MVAEPDIQLRVFRFSTFRSQFKPQSESRTAVWHQLVRDYFTRPHIRESKDGVLFSPAVYGSQKTRKNEHVQSVSMLVFDVDSSGDEISLPEDHADNLSGVAHAYYSTFSSTRASPRWRLILPLARDVLPHEYEAIWKGGLVLLGQDPAIDQACSDISRAYWLPSCPQARSADFFSGSAAGAFVDPDYLIGLSGQAVLAPREAAKVAPIRESTQAPQALLEEAKDCLRYINPDCSYDHWMTVGMALHSVGDDSLLQAWEEWSAKGSKYADAKGTNSPRYMWQTFRPKLGGITIRTLFKMAREAGRESAPLSQAPAAGEHPPLTFRPVSSWSSREVKPREWVWNHWIPKGQSTGLYAPGGTGKTLSVQQLATCVVSGRDFLGHEVSRGAVVGVFCEDDEDELHRRQIEINQLVGTSFADLGQFHAMSRIGEDNILMTFRSGKGFLTPFWHQLYQAIGDIGPELVIVDTAADTFAGNEMDRSQVRQYIQGALTKIAVDHRCAVLVCAHPSQSGIASGKGTAGSTGWENTLRSRLYMVQDPITGRRTLSRMKANYASAGPNDLVEFYWHQGAFIPAASADFDLTIEQHAKVDFLAILDQMTNQQNYPSASPNSQNYAPKMFVKYATSIRGHKYKTASQEAYEKAMYQLLDDGLIEIFSDQRNKITSRIQRSEAAQ